MSTELSAVVVEYKESKISELTKFVGLKATDKKSFEEVTKALSVVRKVRTSIESQRKEFKKSALEYGRRVDAMAEKLTKEVLVIETPLVTEKCRYEEEQQRIKDAEIAAKKTSDEAAWLAKVEAEKAKLKAEQEVEKAKLKAEQEAEKARIEEERIQLGLERAKMASELAELRRVDEAKRREAEDAEAKRRAEEEAKRAAMQAEIDRLREIEQENLRVEREQEAERQRLDKERADHERKEAEAKLAAAIEADRIAKDKAVQEKTRIDRLTAKEDRPIVIKIRHALAEILCFREMVSPKGKEFQSSLNHSIRGILVESDEFLNYIGEKS